MVNVGIIGLGYMAREKHIPSLQRLPNVKIQAVCDLNREIADRTGREVGASAYDSYQEMLEREDLDGIYVLTPTLTHPEIVRAGLDRNCHVFCEKPPALTPAEAREMCKAAERASRVLFFGFNRRFAPAYVKLKQVADQNGAELFLLEKARAATSPTSHMGNNAENEAELKYCRLYGPTVARFMVHFIDLAKWVCGEVKTAYFQSYYADGLKASPGNAVGILEHVGGTRTVLCYNHLAGKSLERTLMHGPRITVETYGGMFEENKVVITTPDDTQTVCSPRDHLEYGGFLEETRHFISMCEQENQRIFPGVDIVDTLGLALALGSFCATDPPGEGK